MNNVEIEHIEVIKLLGVTLDCKLSWSKHIDTTNQIKCYLSHTTTVAKMGRSLSIIKRYSAFLTTLSTRQVPTGPSFYLLNNTINKAGPTGPSFYLLNSTINKAGPTGSSFVTPGLLFSRVVMCHKEGLMKITIGSEHVP